MHDLLPPCYVNGGSKQLIIDIHLRVKDFPSTCRSAALLFHIANM